MTIVYFSATGNSKYVATRISKAGDKLLFIPDLIKENIYEITDDVIGIVSPTYFWGLPSIVKEFLEKAKFCADYLYFVATYGTTPDATGAMAKDITKGKSIDTYYFVRMVDTYTRILDVSAKEKRDSFTKNTEEEIECIIESISQRKHNKCMNHAVTPFSVNDVEQPLYDRKKRLAVRLRVNDSCMGCGLCAKSCPVKAIEIKD